MTNLLTDIQKQEIIEDILNNKNNQQNFLQLMKKKDKGIMIAKKCANLLKQHYGVSKVILFGSLLDYKKMNFNSDIDLAVWNLSEKDYFKAVGFLLDLIGNNFKYAIYSFV